jgi:predicted lipid carrier protein YhbT
MTVNYNVLKNLPGGCPEKRVSLLMLEFMLKKPAGILLQTVLNTFLQSCLIAGDFDFLEGKCVEVRCDDVPVSWVFVLSGQRFVLSDQRDRDVLFSGKSADLLLLAAGRVDPDALFFQRKLLVEGDTELGLAIKNLIFGLDPEEIPSAGYAVLQKLADVVETLRYARQARS